MRNKAMIAVGLLASLTIATQALAQEGHPLTGSWHGAWNPAPTQRNPVMMYMKWDSKNVVGAINPGPNAIPLKVATLDASNWTVHFEADTKDSSGSPAHIVIDGKMENIGWYNRTVTGTWTQGTAKGAFKMTRD